MSASHAYMAAAAAIVAVVAVVNLTASTATAFPESDAWSHVAALDEWASDITDPGHPHIAVMTPSARYIPPFLPLAALSALIGWSALTTFALSAILASAALTAVMYGFYRLLLPDEPWAPLVGLGLLLFGWGLAVPWSGLFELRSLVAVAGYPSAWGFVAGLAMVLAAARAADNSSRWWLGTTALLSAVAMISHPISAMFTYSVAAVVAVDQGWRRFVKPGLAAVAGIALAFAWPFFSLLDVITEPLVFGEGDRLPLPFYSIGRVLALVAPALIGLYALVKLQDRRRLALIGGTAAMTILWLANTFIVVPLGGRFLIYAVFYLHVAAVAWLLPWRRQLTTAEPAAVALRAVVGVLIVGHVFLLIADVGGKRLTVSGISDLPTTGETGIVNQMEDIASVVPDEAIVMADDITGFVLPAFSGKVTAVDRDTFGVDDVAARVADRDEFFAETTMPSRRVELLTNYGATFILFAPEDVGKVVSADLEAMGLVTVTTPFFTLVTP